MIIIDWLNEIKYKQETQLMLTNPRDAFRGQSRSPNIVPFHRLGIVSSCAIVTFSFRFVFPIIDYKKCRDLETRSEVTQGHWKRYHSIDCVWFPISVPWDIRLQKYRDLENWVRGPSRSLEMSPCDRTHTTSYWRFIVTVALSRVLSQIFDVENCRDLEIGVRSHSRSLKVVPFDRWCMDSY